MTPGEGSFIEHVGRLVELAEPIRVFSRFCRVGGALMLVPGLGSAVIPSRVRLLFAVSVTLVLAPVVPPAARDLDPGANFLVLARACLCELAVGISMGLLGRAFIAMIEFLATVASIGIGMANPFGLALEQGEVLPPLATFIGVCASALVFATDLHLQIIAGILESFSAIPLAGFARPDFVLDNLTRTMAEASHAALRIFSPFVAYAILANLMFSLINRLTPQIAVFYVSTPFVVAGGLWILHDSLNGLLSELANGLWSWLARI